MAYCRMGEDGSDVYVYATGVSWVCCCLPDPNDFEVRTREEMVAHLLEHRAKGDHVPQSAIDRLEREIAQG